MKKQQLIEEVLTREEVYRTAKETGCEQFAADSLTLLHEAAPQMARLIRDLKAQRDMAVEALEGVVDSLQYVNQNHPEATGGGVRAERIRKSCDLLAKIKSDEWVG